ncbi:MAG: acyl-CoA dehydrogenase family protein [Ktedonobacterales bacterium]
MISFAPTDEQQLVVDTISRYARERVHAARHEADEQRAYPANLIQEGWRLGLASAWVPEAYGGLGEPHSALNAALFAEELAYGDLTLALYVLTPALFGLPILEFGSQAQQSRWLPNLAGDNFPPLTAALWETGWDFDPSKLQASASRDGEEYVLQGKKVQVPLAADAHALLIYANEGGATQAFIVERDREGLTVGEREQLMGLRALPTYELSLDGCRVPALSRLGENTGCDFGQVQNLSRVTVAALALGVARSALEYAVAYAKERQAFGRPIAQFQSIAFMLAEMQIEVDAARLMLWEAAWNLDQGRPATRECVLAAQYADETGMLVADRAVQIYGGHGYIRENPVELLLRNARGMTSLSGMALL